MAFPKQEYWSGLPFPTPEDLLNSRIKPTTLVSPALTGGFFTNCATQKALSSLDGRPFCIWRRSGEDKTQESQPVHLTRQFNSSSGEKRLPD